MSFAIDIRKNIIDINDIIAVLIVIVVILATNIRLGEYSFRIQGWIISESRIPPGVCVTQIDGQSDQRLDLHGK